MKLTKETLKRIIKEELNKVMSEGTTEQQAQEFATEILKAGTRGAWQIKQIDKGNYVQHSAFIKMSPFKTETVVSRTNNRTDGSDAINVDDRNQILRSIKTDIFTDMKVRFIRGKGNSVVIPPSGGSYPIVITISLRDDAVNRNVGTAQTRAANESAVQIQSQIDSSSILSKQGAASLKDAELKVFNALQSGEWKSQIPQGSNLKQTREFVVQKAIELASEAYGTSFSIR
jgi:hypothetical protein